MLATGRGIETLAAQAAPQPDEAVAALADLARYLARSTAQEDAARIMFLGRRIATPEAVEALLDAAVRPVCDIPTVAAALRFRGPTVVGAILGRLHTTNDRRERRAYFQLATKLAAYPDLHDSVVGTLEAALYDRRAEVVRDAIALLVAIGLPLPPESLGDLAQSPHVPVRLAVAQVLGRWKPSPESCELLCMLIGDEHAGVRLAAAAGLRAYPYPEARLALEQCAARETDAETKAVCLGALKRAPTSEVTPAVPPPPSGPSAPPMPPPGIA